MSKSAENKPSSTTQTKSYKVLITIVGVLAALFAYGVIRGVVSTLQGSGTPTDNITGSTSWKEFNSTKFAFKISFPGLPTASDSSISVQGIDVPTTTYEKDLGDSYYTVQVVSYPSQFIMSDINARLEGALNGSVQNTEGATLTSSSYLTFNGYTALRGTISVPENDPPYTEYELLFLKGNDLYIFLSVGASEDDFNKFVNSFGYKS
jgi:hypothetical protein